MRKRKDGKEREEREKKDGGWKRGGKEEWEERRRKQKRKRKRKRRIQRSRVGPGHVFYYHNTILLELFYVHSVLSIFQYFNCFYCSKFILFIFLFIFLPPAGALKLFHRPGPSKQLGKRYITKEKKCVQMFTYPDASIPSN